MFHCLLLFESRRYRKERDDLGPSLLRPARPSTLVGVFIRIMLFPASPKYECESTTIHTQRSLVSQRLES